MKNPFLFSFLFGIACCLLPLKFTLAATYFFDNFDTASTIDLASKTPGTGTGYTRVINNGQTIYAPSYFDFAAVTASIDNAGALYSANATYTSADYELTAVISFAGGDYNYSRSFALRMQDANNMYLLRITYGSQGFQIYKRVSGTWTLLGSASVSVAGNTNAPYKGDTIKFRVEGNQLTAYQNGVLKLTVTDSDISAAGQAGLGLGYVNISTDDSGTGMGIDDFTVRSLDDDIPPTLSSTFPSDNGTSVTTTANLIMNFDEAVGAKTGNITIYKASDDSIFEQIDVTSGNVSGSGTTMITVNPTSSLNYETDYYVTVDATSFDDASGNSYTGISSSSTWNFTTEDTPTCSTVSHALTYNAYPSCGPATCESGYAVSGGLCVATGGGSTSTPSPSIGTGDSSQSIPMNTRMNIGSILTSGTNILGYIHSSALFTAQESRTQKKSGSYR